MAEGTTSGWWPLRGQLDSLVERAVDERRRLEYQFGLLREDFNLWFDETLRFGGLSTDPAGAVWSVLDLGCGEGLFTDEIARRYPNSHAVGVDSDAAAIGVASARAGVGRNVRFLVRDASHPLVDDAVPAAGFDLAVMWLVLPYLRDRRAALANLAAVLRPGGVVLLGNVPDESMRLDHPAAAGLMAAGRQLVARMGLAGLENSLAPLLREVGFDEVGTEVLRYPVGGATSQGLRWYAYLLTSMSTARTVIVDAFGLLDGAEYDRRFETLATEPVLRLSGEVRFLVTLARRSQA